MKLILRDITQAYIYSKTKLNCTVIYHLPVKLKKRYPKGTILLIIKPLYYLVEVGNHWFATYLDYHKEKLGIEISLYNTYLFISKNGGKNFGIAGFQTDNTLNVRMETIMKKEVTEIIEAKFQAKTQKILETGALRNLNACRMIIETETTIVI